MRSLATVDVFSAVPYRGNPVAVVLDGDGLDTEQMQRFANWANLSETTFLLPPTTPDVDYRVRIFTPSEELPFAGHPTIGSAHAWLAGHPEHTGDTVVQECAVGPVTLRRTLGVVGPYPPGSAHAVEVRAFFPGAGGLAEDPVTGSLNAVLALWLLRTGRVTAPYVAHQGTVLGRDGRVHVDQDPDGTLWIGGDAVTCVRGEVTL